jgi:putative tryptophan/tyrosine transport system substrate-binding protein
VIEYRWAKSRYEDRLPALAADLVRRQVDVIVTVGVFAAALAAKTATTIIPIVFNVGVDPVGSGLVASLQRPGGNLTGVSQFSGDLVPKRLELLHELVPTATLVALFVNPDNSSTAASSTRAGTAAASALGLEIRVVQVSARRDFDSAFASLIRLRAGGLVLASDPLFTIHRGELIDLAARHRVPAIYHLREFAADGGLMSYGPNLIDAYHRTGVFAGKIFKGEKAADLPVQQVERVELVVNLKAAKTIGVDVPASLLARADEIIE